MKNCPDCSAILDDNVKSCPYCGSDAPASMNYAQTYSMDDRTALKKATVAIVIAVIALVINPLFITTVISSNMAGSVQRSSNRANLKIAKRCRVATSLSGMAIFTSTIIFFWWIIFIVV